MYQNIQDKTSGTRMALRAVAENLHFRSTFMHNYYLSMC
ncbi:hypothetical protein SP21_68 [Salmonella phage 21]|nr:hypothetical protein SP21_68 [Salmonella phage 21]